MKEKICRLCLQTINENYQTIGESLKNILKLNMDICKEVVKCIECANNLEVFFNFRSSVYPKNRSLLTNLKDDIHLDSESIEITNNLISFVEFKSEIRCSFCLKTETGKCLISLNESKEHMFLVNVLQEHISKLNLNTTDDLLTCEDCLDGLQGVLSFVMKCMDVEQKISKYIEINGTDANGQIELKDVQQFIFKPKIEFKDESWSVNELEENFEQFQDGYTVYSEADIKFEKEIDKPDLFIKTEEIDIKSEQSDCNSIQESSISSTVIKVDNGSLENPKQCVNRQGLTYKNSAGITMYMCELCPFETKHKNYLKQHKVLHKSTSEIIMFKCELCSFETKHKNYLKRHKLIHKSTSEIIMYKCELCAFETKRKNYLERHKLIHKSTSEIIMFKCEQCPYEAKRKRYLKRHKLTHKSTSELKMYKCELCPFETKVNDSLRRHKKFIHKSSSKLTMFKCDLCPYETERKDSLRQHKLTHRSILEITMLKCELCPFETKHRDSLRQHRLIHKSASDITMYKCDQCSYEAKHKVYITRHQLVHKSASELTMIKCDLCPYEAKRKFHLKRHKLTHKRTLE